MPGLIDSIMGFFQSWIMGKRIDALLVLRRQFYAAVNSYKKSPQDLEKYSAILVAHMRFMRLYLDCYTYNLQYKNTNNSAIDTNRGLQLIKQYNASISKIYALKDIIYSDVLLDKILIVDRQLFRLVDKTGKNIILAEKQWTSEHEINIKLAFILLIVMPKINIILQYFRVRDFPDENRARIMSNAVRIALANDISWMFFTQIHKMRDFQMRGVIDNMFGVVTSMHEDLQEINVFLQSIENKNMQKGTNNQKIIKTLVKPKL